MLNADDKFRFAELERRLRRTTSELAVTQREVTELRAQLAATTRQRDDAVRRRDYAYATLIRAIAMVNQAKAEVEVAVADRDTYRAAAEVAG